MRRHILFVLSLVALGLASIVFMGWFGTANIPHRGFDIALPLLAASVGFGLWSGAKPVEKPE